MKGDFSRNTFDPDKHYSSLRMQQGRVQMDADWNEQMDMLDHRTRQVTEDFLGTVAPATNPGFEITVSSSGTNLNIGPGRYYVNGLNIENPSVISFTKQIDYPDAKLPQTNGVYLTYLQVWQRSLNATDDPSMADIALDGADTATRIRNIAQVKLLPITSAGITGLTYQNLFNINAAVNSTAYINAQNWNTLITRLPFNRNDITQLAPNVTTLPAQTAQTYRVEIHQGGDSSQASYKWSHDSPLVKVIITAISSLTVDPTTGITTGTITIPSASPSTFAVNQWLELTTPARTTSGLCGDMVKITAVNSNVLSITTVKDPITSVVGVIGSDITAANTASAQRWDNTAIAIRRSTTTELEAGLTVSFTGRVFKTGSYWTLTTKGTAFNTVIWPNSNNKFLPQPPFNSANTRGQLTPILGQYPSLQNQLYRFEIHQAAASAKVKSISPALTLEVVALAGLSSFKVGQSLQLTTADRLLINSPPDVVTVNNVTNNIITVTGTVGTDIALNSQVEIPAVKESGSSNYVSTATFKWSRDNASVSARITKISGDNTTKIYTITVTPALADGQNSFSKNQWLELITPTQELAGSPGDMVQITAVLGNVLTVSGFVDSKTTAENKAIARRWDTANSVASTAVLAITPGINLSIEHKLSIIFSGSNFKTGDYWLLPTRAINQSIEWPVDANANYLAQMPQGTLCGYAPLAILQLTSSGWTRTDDSRQIATPINKLSVVGAAPGAPNAAIYVDGGGRVGIGTLTPMSKLEVAGAITVNGGLTALNNGLDITGNTTAKGTITVQNNPLKITGASAKLELGDSSTALSTEVLTIRGKTSTTGDLTVEGTATVKNNSLKITGTSAKLELGDSSTALSTEVLTIKGKTSTTGDLTVEGTATVKNNSLKITGASAKLELGDSSTALSTEVLTIKGKTNTTGDLTVDGTATVKNNSLKVTGVSAKLELGDSSTALSTEVLTIKGKTNTTGDLTVDGTATVKNNSLKITGASAKLELGDATTALSTEVLIIKGKTSTTGDLTVDGILTVKNNSLKITGTSAKLELGDTTTALTTEVLKINGKTNTTGDLTVTGDITTKSLTITDRNSGSFSPLPSPNKIPVADQYGRISRDWIEVTAWSLAKNLPVKLQSFGVVQNNYKIYVVGGISIPAGAPLKTTYIYDLISNSWSQGADLKLARRDFACCTIGTKIYAVAGSGLKSVEVYDTSNPGAGWTLQSSELNAARTLFGIGVVGSKIYVMGGYFDNGSQKTVEVYDTSITDISNPKYGWQQSSSVISDPPQMNTERSSFSAAVVDTKIYAIGGASYKTNGTTLLSNMEVYDTSQPDWGWVQLFPTALSNPRRDHSTSVIYGQIYAIGGLYGSSNPTATTSVEIYDTNLPNPAWKLLPSSAWMKDSRYNFGSAAMNGHIYALGGTYNDRPTELVEIF